MFPSYSQYTAQGWRGGGIATTENPDDPGAPSPQYWAMWESWQPVNDVLGGTAVMRRLHDRYLPRLCNESDECYQTRINRSVLTPLYQRMIKAAVGLIMRKPIVLEGGDEAYFESWRQNVDRDGATLDEFIGKVVYSAIAYGHCGIMVDYPPSDARTLRQEVDQAAKPYLIVEQAPNIIGWRHKPTENQGKLQQVRLREFATEPDGRFGNKVYRQIRVVEPGRFELWREDEYGTNAYNLDTTGEFSIKDIPLAVVYAQREETLFSVPPLLELAHMNIQHYALQASLLNALHVSAFPLLTLRGWDDNSDSLAQLSVGNALSLPPEGGAEYVEPASSAFGSLQEELNMLEETIGRLGITTLARPLNVAESGTAKAIDRADQNSMLSQISLNCEQAVQQAVNWAAEYAGVQPPDVVMNRDFNAGDIEGNLLTQIIQLYSNDVLDKKTVLQILKRGEVLDDSMDIDEIMGETEREELDDLDKELNRITELSKIGEGNQPKMNQNGGSNGSQVRS